MKTIITIGKSINIYVLSIVCFFLYSFAIRAQVGIGTITPLSTFEVNGSVGQKVTTVTADTTLDDTNNLVICSNGSIEITITLPDASVIKGRIYTVKRDASSTANVTVAATPSQTIDAENTYLLATAKQTVILVSDGANWQIISKS